MIYTFEFSNLEKPFSKPINALPLSRSGQAEGIAYLEGSDKIVSNEAGKVYRIRRRD